MAFRQTDAGRRRGGRVAACLPPHYQEPNFRLVCQSKYELVTRLNAVLRLFAVLFAVLLAGVPRAATAQTAGGAGASSSVIADQRANLDALKKKIDDLAAQIETKNDDDAG